jgi:hypothetical protein
MLKYFGRISDTLQEGFSPCILSSRKVICGFAASRKAVASWMKMQACAEEGIP